MMIQCVELSSDWPPRLYRKRCPTEFICQVPHHGYRPAAGYHTELREPVRLDIGGSCSGCPCLRQLTPMRNSNTATKAHGAHNGTSRQGPDGDVFKPALHSLRLHDIEPYTGE